MHRHRTGNFNFHEVIGNFLQFLAFELTTVPIESLLIDGVLATKFSNGEAAFALSSDDSCPFFISFRAGRIPVQLEDAGFNI